MILGVSIIFKAYSQFRNNFPAALRCTAGFGLPQAQFQTDFSSKKTQTGYRPMGQYASGLHTNRDVGDVPRKFGLHASLDLITN